jgi:hypothetical protein
MGDPTLRKGDLVMTADGIRMFRGASHSPYGVSDFIGLAQAPLRPEQRDALTAIERVAARDKRTIEKTP